MIMDTQLIEKANSLFREYIKSENMIKHSKEVAVIMKGLAKHLGKDEDEWYYAGLLHDLDYEEIKDLKTHGLKTGRILKENNFPEEMINAILRHNEENGNKRENLFDYCLSAADNISGLIYAYGLMRKSLKGMEVKGLKKKMKDKKFAENVRRDLIKDIEKYMSLDDFLRIAIESMQSISDELGFQE